MYKSRALLYTAICNSQLSHTFSPAQLIPRVANFYCSSANRAVRYKLLPNGQIIALKMKMPLAAAQDASENTVTMATRYRPYTTIRVAVATERPAYNRSATSRHVDLQPLPKELV
jgi:hypothetical protein